ncbi:hypothetical protein FL966_12720 [Caproiciproducens galactitolivorans]|uniref:Cell division protein FtsL n=1 Tax=Caproiciproducens galactitolivorans TaxID=642589 RepID=A0A4Z0Y8X5_9FIRM|nr:hypothetical protein [Caproiciproducens galactitolivorans]QEY33591.1 hypothetical protein FL966_00075 [Caproiciproducens galactitolivorans]QEY35853.1 hypothetical protein FL966_12720 [Caproiciproducens galactitolivorans]TGJ75721.1 cell division protein FtsL [Caproiciproducens galactitolivorans]
MAASNSNGAYDFALFEPKRQQEAPRKKDNIIEIPKEKLEQNRKTGAKPFRAVSYFLALTVMLGIVGTYVYGQVQLTELTDNLNAAAKTLSESESVYTQTQMKANSKLSLETVENYATGKLGLQKIAQNQVEPISLSKGDKIQVLESDAGENWLSSIWNAIRHLLS